eukprot:4144241-Pleurochrysis_carterae.AAC.1
MTREGATSYPDWTTARRKWRLEALPFRVPTPSRQFTTILPSASVVQPQQEPPLPLQPPHLPAPAAEQASLPLLPPRCHPSPPLRPHRCLPRLPLPPRPLVVAF